MPAFFPSSFYEVEVRKRKVSPVNASDAEKCKFITFTSLKTSRTLLMLTCQYIYEVDLLAYMNKQNTFWYTRRYNARCDAQKHTLMRFQNLR